MNTRVERVVERVIETFEQLQLVIVVDGWRDGHVWEPTCGIDNFPVVGNCTSLCANMLGTSARFRACYLRPVTREQCRAARALLGWTLTDLSNATDISRNAIQAFESGQSEPRRVTLKVLRAALESAGVKFTNGDEPGVALRRRPE